ncbi:MAG: hypothetical protein KY393_08915, partial [Actinobacteria bacterium]|nr:hypothetical protein [Actinomycetota bacterium]
MKYGHERREEPFQLANAGLSHDYIDGKRAIAKGSRYELVAEAVAALAAERGVEFDAVGGMTMGADPIAVAVAVRTDTWWFSVRKEVKKHGKQKRIEGTELTADMKVLLVDDVITTGGSTLSALDAVEAAGDDVGARLEAAITTLGWQMLDDEYPFRLRVQISLERWFEQASLPEDERVTVREGRRVPWNDAVVAP